MNFAPTAKVNTLRHRLTEFMERFVCTLHIYKRRDREARAGH